MSRLGHLIGYHGCELSVAEDVLAGNGDLELSNNTYDWLGPGVYFWLDSPMRALLWAEEQKKKQGWGDVGVVGAIIESKNSLNITDYGNRQILIEAYSVLERLSSRGETQLPTNSIKKDGIYLKRSLDCAVINILHSRKSDDNEEAYDSVHGYFEEGKELYPGSGFKEKNHAQIAVCKPEIIVGYFRPKITTKK